MKQVAAIRKANAVLAALIIVVFSVHGVLGALQMTGLGNVVAHVLSWVLLGLVGLHALIGIYLVHITLIAQKRSGVSYCGANRRFWASRISGFAIIVFMVFHVLIFNMPDDGAIRLAYFGSVQLAVSILLVISIALHVLLNVSPLMISLGVGNAAERSVDIVIVLSLILLIAAAGFAVYFIRWSVI